MFIVLFFPEFCEIYNYFLIFRNQSEAYELGNRIESPRLLFLIYDSPSPLLHGNIYHMSVQRHILQLLYPQNKRYFSCLVYISTVALFETKKMRLASAQFC